MKIIKMLRDANRARLAKRKKIKEQETDPRIVRLLQEARVDFANFDVAAHGSYPSANFFARPKLEFAPPHPAMNDFVRMMQECRGARILIFAPWISRGGADKVTLTFFKVAQKKYGKDLVKLILTEPSPIKTDLPDDILKNIVILNNGKDLPAEATSVDLITRLVHFLAPEHCININSKTFWDALLENGEIIGRNRKISVAAFCTEVLQDGRESGYAYSHLRECAEHVDHIISDNQSFRDNLRNVGILSASTIHKWRVIRQPAEFDFSFDENLQQNCKKTQGNRILWASRICHQKNWSVLPSIAKLNPDVIIDIWGEGPDENKLRDSIRGIGNISLKGSFTSVMKIIQEGGYSAFLYTSRMDGIPNILLEVGASRLPIISSSAGSILDLLNNERAFLVPDSSDIESYSNALRLAISDSNSAKKRAATLLEFIKKHHNLGQTEKSILEVI